MDTQCSLSWGSDKRPRGNEIRIDRSINRSLKRAAIRTEIEEGYVLDTRTTEA